MNEETEKHPAQWALDLLEPISPDPHYKSPLMYFPAFMGALGGISLNFLRNHFARKPKYAGIHISILTTIVSACGLQFLAYVLRARKIRNDTMLYDYIKAHPECFPEPENRKYADILQPWFPVR